MLRVFVAAAVCAAVTTATNAGVMVIEGISTDSGALDGNLEAIETAGGSFPVTGFANAASTSTTNIVHWISGSAPATVGDAVSDQRADTGSLSNETLTYSLTPSDLTEAMFFIFNAGAGTGFQAPLTVGAVDGSGTPIGNLVSINSNTGTVNINDANPGTDDVILESEPFATYSAARPGSSTLFGRLLAGATVDLADFGVGDVSTIAGFVFDGENAAFANVNSLDINAVGLVSTIPEPTSLALLAVGAGVLLRRGR